MEALIASSRQQLGSNAEGRGEPSSALCIRGVVWRWKEPLLKEEPCGNGCASAKPAVLSLPRGKDSRIHVTGSVKAFSAGGTATPCHVQSPSPNGGAPLGTGTCSKVFPECFFLQDTQGFPSGRWE